ncbi:MAG: DUF1330 domain-containing protein [Paracoccaceae bacterium]|nr:DUF1330 domain-containing protein [Paracoccaceae bacterium]
MPAYSIVHADVFDADTYAKYAELAGPAVAAAGGKFLARGGRFEQLEGEGRPRNVLIEWPDYDTAIAFYNGEVYQAAMEFARPSSTREYTIVEGV